MQKTIEYDGSVPLTVEAAREKPDWHAGFDSHLRAKIEWYTEQWAAGDIYFPGQSEIYLRAVAETEADMLLAVKMWDANHNTEDAFS